MSNLYYEQLEKGSTNNVSIDIHKIIDDAIEKKDRYVTIMSSPYGTSVCVRPNEPQPRCKTCGTEADPDHIFCPNCGHYLWIGES